MLGDVCYTGSLLRKSVHVACRFRRWSRHRTYKVLRHATYDANVQDGKSAPLRNADDCIYSEDNIYRSYTIASEKTKGPFLYEK